MNLTKHWAAQLDDYVIDLAWSPDGEQLAAASTAGPLALFDTGDGARSDLPGHDDGANCLAWHPAFPILASGGQDGSVKFWDTSTDQHIATASLGSGWVEHLAWQPAASTTPALAAGRSLALLNADGSVRHTFEPAPRSLCALGWHPRGHTLAAAHFGGIRLLAPDGDFGLRQEFFYTKGIHALVWSPPDGRWLVSGNQDRSVHLWLPDENQEFHMSGYESKVKELSFDRTGRWLATGGGQDACLWDCSGAGPEGREPLMFPHGARVCAVAFQNAHNLLATAAQDGGVSLWNPERPQPLRANVKMPAAATRLVWSPDDSQPGHRHGEGHYLRAQGGKLTRSAAPTTDQSKVKSRKVGSHQRPAGAGHPCKMLRVAGLPATFDLPTFDLRLITETSRADRRRGTPGNQRRCRPPGKDSGASAPAAQRGRRQQHAAGERGPRAGFGHGDGQQEREGFAPAQFLAVPV
ncbi:MAG: WD40 repeat domain-containing protein [Opitutaceae bacterium]|jgi:WD40 repeat protein|nr:WD40 repeat domain-containing protein [Opitutaceae bacterium]